MNYKDIAYTGFHISQALYHIEKAVSKSDAAMNTVNPLNDTPKMRNRMIKACVNLIKLERELKIIWAQVLTVQRSLERPAKKTG